MGKVAVELKVLPEGPEVDVEMIANEIKNKIEAKEVKIEPFVFGMKMIKVLTIVDDSEGTDNIEKSISEIKGVGEVEVESVTLI